MIGVHFRALPSASRRCCDRGIFTSRDNDGQGKRDSPAPRGFASIESPFLSRSRERAAVSVSARETLLKRERYSSDECDSLAGDSIFFLRRCLQQWTGDAFVNREAHKSDDGGSLSLAMTFHSHRVAHCRLHFATQSIRLLHVWWSKNR